MHCSSDPSWHLYYYYFEFSIQQIKDPQPPVHVPAFACQELCCIAGGEQWASKRSFIGIYSCSSSFILSPEFHLLSYQRLHQIFIGVQNLLWTIHVKDRDCMSKPLSSFLVSPSSRGCAETHQWPKVSLGAGSLGSSS